MGPTSRRCATRPKPRMVAGRVNAEFLLLCHATGAQDRPCARARPFREISFHCYSNTRPLLSNGKTRESICISIILRSNEYPDVEYLLRNPSASRERKEKEKKRKKNGFSLVGARGSRNEAIVVSRGLATLESHRESSAAWSRGLSSA